MDDMGDSEAELDTAVFWALKIGIFFNQGQVCSGSSRVFVHEKIYDRFLEKAVKVAKDRKVGDPLQEGTEQGPQQNQTQLNTVLRYIKIGKEVEASCVVGGERIGTEGYFIQPTIFTDVTMLDDPFQKSITFHASVV
jgi:aldehyde dehydrogenase (NAD+)